MLGAGSKGFMILYCPMNRKNKILTNLKKLVHIPFLFENKGTHIINI